MEINKATTFITIQTTAFSGATLLSILLGGHPEITTIGELGGLVSTDDPDEYLCSCGQRIKECEFWHSVTVAMSNRGYEFDVANFQTNFKNSGPQFIQKLRVGSVRNNYIDSFRDSVLFSLPSEKRKIKAHAGRNVALINSILEVTDKEILIDSSKNRMRLRALRKFSKLDIRAIHFVRRVEGVVASQVRRGRGSDVARLARDWVKRHDRIGITLAAWPQEKHTLVRYEDLCQQPESTLLRVIDFCGAAPNLKRSNFQEITHHVIGNPIRLKPITEIKLDERWKTELTTIQIQEINRVAGSLNKHYGYSD